MAARKSNAKKPAAPSRKPKSRGARPDMGEEGDLSPAQVRELEKRIKDLNDRTRFMLVSTLSANFVLYYNVSDDTYGWNDPTHATLFKRKLAAQAIQKLLGDKDSLVQCAVNKKGELVKKSLVLPASTEMEVATTATPQHKKAKKKASKSPAQKPAKRARR